VIPAEAQAQEGYRRDGGLKAHGVVGAPDEFGDFQRLLDRASRRATDKIGAASPVMLGPCVNGEI